MYILGGCGGSNTTTILAENIALTPHCAQKANILTNAHAHHKLKGGGKSEV